MYSQPYQPALHRTFEHNGHVIDAMPTGTASSPTHYHPQHRLRTANHPEMNAAIAAANQAPSTGASNFFRPER
ncbi:hypothetical protein BV898_18036 [Hypsibius exemplaris]|uniref:Uncharacterized protein n=1 Tax=Hypsibius exemplaris TaxID=2072580 RepID=A0A9X6RN25_HYPEX|nr:hypothetical protein BV898_18036 [Hypsibius exemplaris]